ncbi:unnamed protein product [Effrenium voratum]|uniref:Uncharacterized protein n=1 Tax=Effrenium voratum TaxID=2562239 RepID=A0AA36MW97_9DINO|nr:unnamed protein product [Effrenium voratum]CAJ1382156.1 unnamed protein product [Effrenium voratum]CAJ1445049.1 unnamed protein product [Effrenium voratum]
MWSALTSETFRMGVHLCRVSISMLALTTGFGNSVLPGSLVSSLGSMSGSCVTCKPYLGTQTGICAGSCVRDASPVSWDCQASGHAAHALDARLFRVPANSRWHGQPC